MDKRYQALAIGQLSLSVRLLNITAGLALSGATDPKSLRSLSKNVHRTLTDCEKAVKLSGSFSSVDKKLVSCISTVSQCAQTTQMFLNKKNFAHKVKQCTKASETCVSNLSEYYNSFYKTIDRNNKKEKKDVKSTHSHGK